MKDSHIKWVHKLKIFNGAYHLNYFICFSEPPKSNHLCPRRNGYFAHPDESVCNIFYNCIEGEATEIVCPTGLHFDEYSGTCVWPDAAGRTGCGTKEASKSFAFDTFFFLILIRV